MSLHVTKTNKFLSVPHVSNSGQLERERFCIIHAIIISSYHSDSKPPEITCQLPHQHHHSPFPSRSSHNTSQLKPNATTSIPMTSPANSTTVPTTRDGTTHPTRETADQPQSTTTAQLPLNRTTTTSSNRQLQLQHQLFVSKTTTSHNTTTTRLHNSSTSSTTPPRAPTDSCHQESSRLTALRTVSATPSTRPKPPSSHASTLSHLRLRP